LKVGTEAIAFAVILSRRFYQIIQDNALSLISRNGTIDVVVHFTYFVCFIEQEVQMT
jgi:hypothetical protein